MKKLGLIQLCKIKGCKTCKKICYVQVWKGKVMYKPERENVNINLWKNSDKYSPVKERVIKPAEKYT